MTSSMSMCSPPRANPYSSWLDVLNGDKSFIDPRTLPVHRVVFKDPTRHKSKSLRTYLPRASPRDRCAFVANWVATNRRTWENGGFDPVPRDDIVDDDTIDDSEDDESLVLQKYLQLETSPPFPMQNATESLLGPQDQRRRKSIFRLFRSG